MKQAIELLLPAFDMKLPPSFPRQIRTLLEGEVVSTLVDVDGVLAGDDVLKRRTLLAGLKGQQRCARD